MSPFLMRKGTNSLQFIRLLNKTKEEQRSARREKKTSEKVSTGVGGGRTKRIREVLKVFN